MIWRLAPNKMKKPALALVALLLMIALWFSFRGKSETTQEKSNPEARTKRIRNSLSHEERATKRRGDQEKQRAKIVDQAIMQINVPIYFWGKVVDQDGTPLEGVSIRYRVSQPRVMWDSKTVIRHTTTDSKGAFYIKDKGDGFSFEAFEKAGYINMKGQRTAFTYSNSSERYTPDKSAPKVYTLIQEGQLPGLIRADGWTTLNWDGRPVHYNLRTGKFGISGEIKITALRGKIKGEGRQARYDWSCRIEVIDGGIIEAAQDRVYLAPTDGYKQLLDYGYLATDPKWGRSTGDVHLVFRLEDGSYGRLMIKMNARQEIKFSCRVSSYLNPSGGRILEYDAQRRIK